MSVYVDDFKLAGPPDSVDKGWDLIRQFVEMEPPQTLDLYLGCKHEQTTVKLPTGNTAQVVIYNMEEYLQSSLDKYCKLASNLEGKPVYFRDVATPSMVDDQSTSPQGAPAFQGACIKCPWCKFAFPKYSADSGIDSEKENPTERSGSKKKKPKLANPDQPAGVLQPIAASILMKVLYAARMARFDLLFTVSRLACYISKWTTDCDRRLYRLMCYINSTKHLRLVGWVADEALQLRPHVYADADLAGCADTQRSTTGIHANLQGPTSCFPICGVSKRQGCVSSSTPEAEMVAGHHAYNKIVVPQMDLWSNVLGPHVRGVFHEDNEAMIQVIRTGRNPTMRQLGRVHRVAIAVLHERLGGPDRDAIDLVHTKSADMSADIYTKAFSAPDDWAAVLNNVNIFDPAKLQQVIAARLPVLAEGSSVTLPQPAPMDVCLESDTDGADHGIATPLMVPVTGGPGGATHASHSSRGDSCGSGESRSVKKNKSSRSKSRSRSPVSTTSHSTMHTNTHREHSDPSTPSRPHRGQQRDTPDTPEKSESCMLKRPPRIVPIPASFQKGSNIAPIPALCAEIAGPICGKGKMPKAKTRTVLNLPSCEVPLPDPTRGEEFSPYPHGDGFPGRQLPPTPKRLDEVYVDVRADEPEWVHGRFECKLALVDQFLAHQHAAVVNHSRLTKQFDMVPKTSVGMIEDIYRLAPAFNIHLGDFEAPMFNTMYIFAYCFDIQNNGPSASVHIPNATWTALIRPPEAPDRIQAEYECQTCTS